MAHLDVDLGPHLAGLSAPVQQVELAVAGIIWGLCWSVAGVAGLAAVAGDQAGQRPAVGIGRPVALAAWPALGREDLAARQIRLLHESHTDGAPVFALSPLGFTRIIDPITSKFKSISQKDPSVPALNSRGQKSMVSLAHCFTSCMSCVPLLRFTA